MGDETHRLLRVSSPRKPQARGDMYFPNSSGHSNAKMTFSEREAYINNYYFQAAGEPAAPIDPRYQFSLLLGFRDDGFQTASIIDMKITATEVCLLQHLSLKFDPQIGPNERVQFQQKITKAVREILDNKVDIVEVQGTEKTRRRLRVAVNFDQDPASHGVRKEVEPMAVHTGSGRANSRTLYMTSSNGVIAHEMAHRMLAAYDEYADRESLRRAPERQTGGFEIEEELAGKTRARLMQNSDNGALFPSNVLAIAGILRKAIGKAGESVKFCAAFAPNQQPALNASAEEILKKTSRSRH